MHIYYWKEVKGSIVPVDYTVCKDRRTIVFTLKDGVVDEDGKANGVIVDPFIFYIPRFNVTRELHGSWGVLHIFDLNGSWLYDVKVEVSRGNISYLAFVDSGNIPNASIVFPFQLVKFRVEGLEKGEEVEVRITYPYLPNVSKIGFFKFNPNTFNWNCLVADVDNRTVVFKVKDGGLGDDDGTANGVVEDDGGVTYINSLPYEITVSGYYVLNTDCTDLGSSYAIKITASDVVLEGNGHTLDGIDGSNTYGIWIIGSPSSEVTNVTVRNVTVVDWIKAFIRGL
jgi:hypothetical protein